MHVIDEITTLFFLTHLILSTDYFVAQNWKQFISRPTQNIGEVTSSVRSTSARCHNIRSDCCSRCTEYWFSDFSYRKRQGALTDLSVKHRLFAKPHILRAAVGGTVCDRASETVHICGETCRNTITSPNTSVLAAR